MKIVPAALAVSLWCSIAFAAPTAENQTAEIVKHDGLTVVHLWAPWCSNCLAEMKSGGWTKMVNDNPNVQFVFVSVWNGGDPGDVMLKRFDLAGKPNVTIVADPGPRTGADKLKRFLDLPVSWIPTTWIFKGGDLRYAMNYGEVRFDVLQQFLADSENAWSH
jgi:thiol-disulfide isomerase/thioredoxin